MSPSTSELGYYTGCVVFCEIKFRYPPEKDVLDTCTYFPGSCDETRWLKFRIDLQLSRGCNCFSF
jgi:hypothetical protein